jgi:sec-independent protein translocase protein TatB
MIDFGLDKLALIGAVALVVIGPEKLPRVARTVGHLLGKARRYMADVQAEVSRSIELDELKRMRQELDAAGRAVDQTVHSGLAQVETSLEGAWHDSPSEADAFGPNQAAAPSYRHPGKRWRLKTSAVPQWYKHRQGIRSRVQSGAARVARFRPIRRF